MKFITISLIVHAPDPATGVQVLTNERFRQVVDAADGFILVPHVTPGGLDAFADKVVPILQERGRFRADYEGTTLRDHLGLAAPGKDRHAEQPAVAAAGAVS